MYLFQGSEEERRLRHELDIEKSRANKLQEQLNARDAHALNLQSKVRDMRQLLKAQQRSMKDLGSDNTDLSLRLQAQMEQSNNAMLQLISDMESTSKEQEDAARVEGVKDGKAAAKKVIAAEKTKSKRLSHELVSTQAEVASMHEALPRMMKEATDQATKAEGAKYIDVIEATNESLAAEKSRAQHLEDVCLEDELKKQRLRSRYKLNNAAMKEYKKRQDVKNALHEEEVAKLQATLTSQWEALKSFEHGNKDENLTFDDMCRFFLSPELYAMHSDRQTLNALGQKAKNIKEMGDRGRRELAKLVSFMMNEILEVAFAGKENDHAAMLQAIAKLTSSKGTPIGEALEGFEASTKGVDAIGLATAYISLRHTREKVYFILSSPILFFCL